MTFNQKETAWLKEMKAQEELCIEKYGQYAAAACDSELKTLFTNLRSTEQKHLGTLNGYLGETSPLQTAPLPESAPSSVSGNDKLLCQDMLTMEKHVSSVYDTCIFEFTDSNVRQELNRIQSDEQKHGEQIYQYMSKNGMY